MAKKLWSVFTDDMDHCYFTGAAPVERHHMKGGAFRNKCEKYGFVLPLRPDLHPNGVRYDRNNLYGVTDDMLKKMMQTYFEEHHGSREEFIAEFGKNYL